MQDDRPSTTNDTLPLSNGVEVAAHSVVTDDDGNTRLRYSWDDEDGRHFEAEETRFATGARDLFIDGKLAVREGAVFQIEAPGSRN